MIKNIGEVESRLFHAQVKPKKSESVSSLMKVVSFYSKNQSNVPKVRNNVRKLPLEEA